jgi:hypothetical protein
MGADVLGVCVFFNWSKLFIFAYFLRIFSTDPN